MRFPGGPASLPTELLCSNMSGPTQVTAAEQPVRLSRMSTEALNRFADDMVGLLETEVMSGDPDERVIEMADLWAHQAQAELALRFAEASGEIEDEPHASREEIPDERDADDWAHHAE